MLVETMDVVRQADYAAADRLAMQVSNRLITNDPIVDSEVRDGRPSEVILNRAVELAADLHVIGAKGLSAPAEFRLGSTAHNLAHYAECSVLVARSINHAQPSKIILAADGSIEAQRAAKLLCRLALPEWAEVTVVSVAEVNASLTAGNETTEQNLVADVPEAVPRAHIDAAEGHISKAGRCLNECSAQVRSAIRFGHPMESGSATSAEASRKNYG